MPVYLNLFTTGNGSVSGNETATTLSFYDSPADDCLPGGSGDSCGGSAAPAGTVLAFTTHLVGIIGNTPSASVIDTGVGFSWTSTFNGTNGGIVVSNAFTPVDPGSGSGGITVTAISETSYNQSGASPLPTLLSGTQVSGVLSDLSYDPAGKIAFGILSITNVSDSTITGPFQFVLDSLTPGVTLMGSTGTFGGWQYMTVPNRVSLEPGQSALFNAAFSNPEGETITFSPMIYSGSFK